MASDPQDFMWAEACAALERMEQMHRQFFRPRVGAMPAAIWQPPVDVFETADVLRIAMALPGVEAQEVEVSVDAGTLTISGVRHLPAWARGADIRRLEIPYGRFERQLALPSGRFEVRPAELANGCLFITLSRVR